MVNDLKRISSSPERVLSDKDKTVSVHPRRSSGHRQRATVSGELKDDRDKNGDAGSGNGDVRSHHSHGTNHGHHTHSHTHAGDLTPVGSSANMASGSVNSMGVMGSAMGPSERLGSLSLTHSGAESPGRSGNMSTDAVLGSVAGTPGANRGTYGDVSSSAPASTLKPNRLSK